MFVRLFQHLHFRVRLFADIFLCLTYLVFDRPCYGYEHRVSILENGRFFVIASDSQACKKYYCIFIFHKSVFLYNEREGHFVMVGLGYIL
jgi:hypothetical protein